MEGRSASDNIALLLIVMLFLFFHLDNAFISPELQTIFERVRDSADFMPRWQLEVRKRF